MQCWDYIFVHNYLIHFVIGTLYPPLFDNRIFKQYFTITFTFKIYRIVILSENFQKSFIFHFHYVKNIILLTYSKVKPIYIQIKPTHRIGVICPDK